MISTLIRWMQRHSKIWDFLFEADRVSKSRTCKPRIDTLEDRIVPHGNSFFAVGASAGSAPMV